MSASPDLLPCGTLINSASRVSMVLESASNRALLTGTAEISKAKNAVPKNPHPNTDAWRPEIISKPNPNTPTMQTNSVNNQERSKSFLAVKNSDRQNDLLAVMLIALCRFLPSKLISPRSLATFGDIPRCKTFTVSQGDKRSFFL